jgi:mannose-1-phosphate guanylyltransferase
MKEHFYAVIMAGGGGTRLWPLSRKSLPKQSITLFGDRTMFQIAVDRLDGLFTPDHIFVVTVAEQAEQLHLQVPQLPTANFLIEPMPRGTASVVAMAATALHKKDPEAVMAVLTADHFIKNVVKFQAALKAAYQAAQDGSLLTLGIPPKYAATGYGYIESGEIKDSFKDLSVHKVNAFKEKPKLVLAQEFLERGNFSWNSGMFIWRTDAILEEFKSLMPNLFAKVEILKDEIGENHLSDHFHEIWGSIAPETIDYGIMEKSDHCAVIPVDDLNWSDVGSWDSLFDVLNPDINGNILIHANYIGLETNNSLIFSSDPKRLIVTIGMKNLILVDTGDAVLICPRGESQRVKELVIYLKDHHLTPFL